MNTLDLSGCSDIVFLQRLSFKRIDSINTTAHSKLFRVILNHSIVILFDNVNARFI